MRGWKYLFTFGFYGLVYGNHSRRRMVDSRTGEITLEYSISERLETYNLLMKGWAPPVMVVKEA